MSLTSEQRAYMVGTIEMSGDVASGLPSDYTSECDGCHCHKPLWIDPSTVDAGEFGYCADCWQDRAERSKRMLGESLQSS